MLYKYSLTIIIVINKHVKLTHLFKLLYKVCVLIKNKSNECTWFCPPCAGWSLEEASPESECCWQRWWSCTAASRPCGLHFLSQPQKEDGRRYALPLSPRSPTAEGKESNYHIITRGGYKAEGCHISKLQYFYFSDSGSCDTHHYWIIVSTPHSEDQSCSFICDPACRHHHLPLIPHPANEVSQWGVLGDVIVAGRNWHVNHWAGLRMESKTYYSLFLTVDLLHSESGEFWKRKKNIARVKTLKFRIEGNQKNIIINTYYHDNNTNLLDLYFAPMTILYCTSEGSRGSKDRGCR